MNIEMKTFEAFVFNYDNANCPTNMTRINDDADEYVNRQMQMLYEVFKAGIKAGKQGPTIATPVGVSQASAGIVAAILKSATRTG